MPVKNIIPGQRVKKEKLQRARELRRAMTPAEKILWQELRSNKLGIHFRPPPPASRSTSPKYDNNILIIIKSRYVVFGGGRVGAREGIERDGINDCPLSE